MQLVGMHCFFLFSLTNKQSVETVIHDMISLDLVNDFIQAKLSLSFIITETEQLLLSSTTCFEDQCV